METTHQLIAAQDHVLLLPQTKWASAQQPQLKQTVSSVLLLYSWRSEVGLYEEPDDFFPARIRAKAANILLHAVYMKATQLPVHD